MADKELGILIRAKGAAQASAAVKGVDSSFNSLTHRAGTFATSLKTNVSGALTTFGGRLKQAAAGITTFLGVGGILGIGGAIAGSVSKLDDFSLSLEKVQTLTGETAQDSGTLILLFQKFGISLDQVGTLAGFAEKTLGKLNQATATSAKVGKSAALVELERQKLERQSAGLSTKKVDGLIREQKATDALNASLANAADGTTKLQAIEKQYGLSLIDANGKTVSFSQELMQLADFYDRNHDAAQRAYVASVLFGKGYAALAPILDQGSTAIRQAAQEASDLGLGSADTAKQIIDFRNTMRDLGQQADVLQLSIGMALVPTLDKFAHSLSDFITGHRTEIAGFFRDIGTLAEQAVGTIANLVGTASAFWNMLPGPFRDLLLAGIAGDRIIKFAFGFSPIHIVTSLATSAIGGLLGGVGKALGASLAGAGIGKLFVQPVFVTNPGFGGVGGGAAGAVEGAAAEAGGLSLGAIALGLTAVTAFGVAVGLATKKLDDVLGVTPGNLRQQQFDLTGSRLTNEAAASGAPATANQREDRGILVATRDHGWEVADDSLKAALGRLSGVMTKADWLKKLQASWLKAGQTMHDKIKAALAGIGGPNSKAAAAFLGSHLGNAGFGAGGYDQAVAAIAGLKNLHTTDPTVVRAIQQLEARLPRLKITKADLEAAEKEAQSTDPKNKKLDELNRIMAELRKDGDRTTQRKVADLISAVRHQKTTVNLKTSASTFVKIGVGGITKAQTVIRVYGTGGATGKYLA